MNQIQRITYLAKFGLTNAARDNVDETGIDPKADVQSLRDGETEESLLARCLDQADDDRAEGWRDYVSALTGYLADEASRLAREAIAAGHESL